MNAAQQKEDRKLIELVDGMDREELKRPMKYTRMNGQKGEDSVGDVLVTLYNHQTHHRGQVHTMLTQIGVDPPDMDVIDYLHSKKLVVEVQWGGSSVWESVAFATLRSGVRSSSAPPFIALPGF